MNEIAIEKLHGKFANLWSFIAVATLIFVTHETTLAIGIGASILTSGGYLWLCHQYFKTKNRDKKEDVRHYFNI
ncbi:hypothetical protein [Paraburkholderia aromaticivorans]|uniref:hypothetical protein n=1 Tax=Paraburkholderia aromaticivorans TaxID=2026199 RepID=UPI0038B8BFB6